VHSGVRNGLALALAALMLVGCVPASDTSGIRISSVPGPVIDRPQFPAVQPQVKGLVAGLPGDDLTAYLAQRPDWKDCGESTVCADVLAPLDYANPGASAVTLSLRRLPATKEPHLGTLFVNPGGPGGSGKGLVARFDREGLEQYDIVGWDPRGTGDSTPVQCYGAAETDALLNLDASPDDAAERASYIQASYEFGRSCWQHSGSLLEHVSTIETVRDLDLLRRLLGDSELHYLGYSYGTQIGATYAELFGQHSGRMVLDAAVNITGDDTVVQSMGFDLALGNFAAWCAKQNCALGKTKQAVLDAVTGLLTRLDGAAVAAGKRRLTQSLAVSGIAAMLYYGKEGWPTLVQLIAFAEKGNGRPLLYAADSLNSRDDKGNYEAGFYAFNAVRCLDSDDEDGVLDADRTWADDSKKAPVFGRYSGPDYTCPLWPVRPVPQLTLRGASAKPLLVIGGTGDNATPYQQAVSMAKQLESGILVTYEGEGHGSYGGKSTCVDRIVVGYLVKGTLPADGVRCS
jgi:pimeloyl-ACP methyl ester carboxylesterase